ncbi:RecQ family ATP-dependent DNA helicase [Stieleria sp. ICT_E10.1]|uniref:RecQ family ATP-dependent DNA helicase n=1 Tax=Stieleria sedimenti TaxID=2976331 RepID=UPI00217F91FA|nr:ATP-dependent DNA helicase RecQ [Stieleria sedimenti]MCS7468313.1 RecQ family ATP-dependent DNA helicase [Stieleria sedimenti]
MDDVRRVLKQFWGFDSFRPLQEQSIQTILEGRDSLTVLPTGAGKSICFQAPALCSGLHGSKGSGAGDLAVVVSPLISLMKDQVDALKQKGVPAAFVNSTQDETEKRDVADRIRHGDLRLLYLAPERLLSPKTLGFLRQQQCVRYFAIDEAHCVSQWGHDFRPEYQQLKTLKQVFPEASVHAFTATASQPVRRDIARQLGLSEPSFLVGNFDRPNLTYRMIRAGQKMQQIMEVVDRHRGQSGIIYCLSRREVDTTTQALRTLGLKAKPYHAGLTAPQRKANQDSFMQGRCDIIVATIAFGMGIDKSNIRFVIHTGMPKSVEHYQQESGRAGRDGLDSECVLLHSPRDFLVWSDVMHGEAGQVARDALQAMFELCNDVTCRHKAIVEYFGQDYGVMRCGACDVCLGELELHERSADIGRTIVACVQDLKQKYGAGYVARVLAGKSDKRIVQSNHDRLNRFGALGDHGPMAIKVWIQQLISQKYLCRSGSYKTLAPTESGRRLLRGQGTPKLTATGRSKKSADGSDSFVPAISSLAAFDYFRSGDSIESVAQKMSRAQSTVVKYLADYIRHHGINDPTPWVKPETAQRVLANKHLAGDGKMKPIFDHFNGEVSYDEIRITLACSG